jgi:hypothetical protein
MSKWNPLFSIISTNEKRNQRVFLWLQSENVPICNNYTIKQSNCFQILGSTSLWSVRERIPPSSCLPGGVLSAVLGRRCSSGSNSLKNWRGRDQTQDERKRGLLWGLQKSAWGFSLTSWLGMSTKHNCTGAGDTVRGLTQNSSCKAETGQGHHREIAAVTWRNQAGHSVYSTETTERPGFGSKDQVYSKKPIIG